MGETEFANGVAAMSASGAYGTPRICAGIISTVDLELGPERAGAALRAHMAASPNFRGIRAPIPAEFTTAYKEAFALLGEYDLLFESCEPPRYRCRLSCILLKMAAMSFLIDRPSRLRDEPSSACAAGHGVPHCHLCHQPSVRSLCLFYHALLPCCPC